ncbi:MAG: hypothetical protein LAT63_11325 [Marinobacter sp.]|nr:hypothetical protein [Marinobacter sp.]
MKPRLILLPLCAAVAAGTLTAHAGVRTLTSDEMLDTYIQDSAIIVVPREQRLSEQERERIIGILTISPGEPVMLESDEVAYFDDLRRKIEESRSGSLTAAEEEFIRRTLALSSDELARVQPPSQFTAAIPPLIFGQTPQIPDEPFTQTFLNDQLGIAFDGQQLTFSIGNPPGIDKIQIPHAINEGPINLQPRPGGGFDLSIQVPDR